MYGYRKAYQPQDTRGFGLFALPFLGGLAGGLLGSALNPRPFYGYPGLGTQAQDLVLPQVLV